MPVIRDLFMLDADLEILGPQRFITNDEMSYMGSGDFINRLRIAAKSPHREKVRMFRESIFLRWPGGQVRTGP